MTLKEWERRCTERILRVVKKAGRIRIRELKRATHYNRQGEDGIPTWYDALDSLENGGKIQVETNEDGVAIFVGVTTRK